MLHTSNFFKRVRSIAPKDILLHQAVTESVEQILHYKIDKKDIKTSGTTIFLNLPSLLRYELKMKQEEILKLIEQILGNGYYQEIR